MNVIESINRKTFEENYYIIDQALEKGYTQFVSLDGEKLYAVRNLVQRVFLRILSFIVQLLGKNSFEERTHLVIDRMVNYLIPLPDKRIPLTSEEVADFEKKLLQMHTLTNRKITFPPLMPICRQIQMLENLETDWNELEFPLPSDIVVESEPVQEPSVITEKPTER